VDVIKYLVNDWKMDINYKNKDDGNGFTLACDNNQKCWCY